MPPARLPRRSVLLSVTIAGAMALSGCLSPRLIQGGRLTITNERGQEHTVNLSITKTSHNPDDTKRSDEPPAPETTPIWQRHTRVTIGPRGKIIEEKYIDELGAYYLEARLDTGETASNWFWLGKDARGGLGGPMIWVSIPATGFMTVGRIHE